MSFRISKTHKAPKRSTKTVESEVDNFLSDDFLFNLDEGSSSGQAAKAKSATEPAPRKSGSGMYIRPIREAEADFF